MYIINNMYFLQYSFMNFFFENLKDILYHPIYSFIVICNIVVMEGLLSVDNAAILATIILKINEKDRKKFLKYGIIGAYLFRGICLIFASLLIKVWWLKPIGGIYLFYIGIRHFLSKNEKYNFFSHKIILSKLFNNFWINVFYIELIDLLFSIDNIFTAVAFSKNLLLIYIGVFLGILSMRFIVNFFIILMKKNPSLENSAFLVIIFLGLKLIISILDFYYPNSFFVKIINSFYSEIISSIITIIIFIIPLLINKKNKTNYL